MITYVGHPKLEVLTYNIPVLGQKMFVAGSPAHKSIATHYFGTPQIETVADVFLGMQVIADKVTWMQAELLAKHAILKPWDIIMHASSDDRIFSKLCSEMPVYAATRSVEDKVSFPVFGVSHQLEGLHYLVHSIITDPDDTEQKSLALCELIAKYVTAADIRHAESFEKMKSIQRREQIRAAVAKAKVLAKA